VVIFIPSLENYLKHKNPDINMTNSSSINALLEELGLTDSESKVYLALLELGASPIGSITKKTGIHRRNIYDITDRLIKKGLIGYITKNNIKTFEAVNPRRLRDILKEKEKNLDDNFPFLEELFSRTKEKQETNFYKGKAGLKAVFQDQLEQNKEVLIIGATPQAEELLPFYFKWYDQTRLKKKINMKIIAYESLPYKIPLSEIRFLPGKYSNPLAINIFKDKVAIILWKKDPLAIVIKNDEIASSYKKHFDFLWKQARK